MPDRVPSYRKPSLPRAKQEQKRAAPFYSLRAWRGSEAKKGVRELQLESHPLCKTCKDEGRLTQATEVHHVAKVKDDPSRSLDMGNLWSLCKACHSRMTGRGE